MLGFVYILEDDLHKYYIGSCTDLAARYKKHVSNSVHTSKRMKNPRIVFSQEYSTIQEAQSIERRLKKLKRKDYIRKIVEDGFIKIK